LYEKVIDITRKEVIRLIKEQVQGVFEQLLRTPDLLKSQKQDQQQRNLSCEVIEQWMEILKGEAYKVERLEVAFAVVGTMKSGKSTTINAIVGTEVLPNRNQPMTTLPTVIRHCAGKNEPELTFANPQPFNDLIDKLRAKLQEKQNNGQLDQIAFCATEDGKELVEKILDGSLAEIRQHYKGNEEIFDFLKCINDIWRLCSTDDITIDIDEYLDQYDEIHQFPAIEVEFFHLRGQEYEQSQGSFALIDTPGPNEAGQTFLKHIMKEQLEKASAVLAVLDYTQLNAEADAEIRKSLDQFANVTDNRLFVLVNKFDQKDRHGMDAETLRSYVVKQLFEGRLEKERVFPVSSKYGYLANRALNELFSNGKLPDFRFNPWVEDFGRLALGACWESEIEDVAEVKSRAAKLWRNSLFDQPLTEVIKKGSENAALMSLKSAVAKMLDYDKKIVDSLQFRQNALNTDIKVLENHIKTLEEDIRLIKDARDDARRIITESTKTLQKKIYQMFDESEELLKKEIQAVFNHKKSDSWLSKRLEGYVGKITKDVGAAVEFDPKGYNDFATEAEARQFLNKLIETVANHIEPTLQQMQQLIKTTVDEMAESIWAGVNSRLEKVLKSAEERLHESFAVMIDFPKPKVRSIVVDFDRMRQSSITEDSITKTGTKYERKWYTLWCRKHEISFQYEEQVYRIYTKDVVEQLQQLLEEDSNRIWTSLDKYVRNEFSKAINTYFAEIADYLERFRGDLVDSKRDKELENEHMENLQTAMCELLKRAAVHRKDVQVLGEGLPDKMLSGTEKAAG